MRSLSEAKEVAWRSPGTVTHLRVQIAGEGGLVDWTDLVRGECWIESAQWGESDDQPGLDATITLVWRAYYDNASPFVEAGQRLEGALSVRARVVISVAVMPADVTPSASDWEQVFDGQVDGLSLDYPVATLQCRDRITAQLTDRWIEQDTPYGTASGRPVEYVIQDVIDDWAGSPAIYLWRPGGSPGYLITAYNQSAGPVIDAVQQLAAVLGWQVRPRWGQGAGTFLLALTEPDRAATVPVFEFYPSEVYDFGSVEAALEDVRNVVEVVYTDGTLDSGGQLVIKRVVVEDAGSIVKYGRRYFGLTEGSSSSINTTGEATDLADAILSDLKEPKVALTLEVPLIPWLEIGDLVRVQADGERFGAHQDLAVVGLRHTINAQDPPKTTLQLYGQPRTGRRTWLEREARAGVAPSTTSRTPATPLPPDVKSWPTGAELIARWPATQGMQSIEFHRSVTANFTPSATTLLKKGLDLTAFDDQAEVGTTTYYKIIVTDELGNRSSASAQSIGTLAWTPPARLAKALRGVVQARRVTSDQTISAGAPEVVQLNSEIWDTQGIWGAGNYRLQPLATGLYKVTLDLRVSFDLASQYEITIQTSGGSVVWTSDVRAAVTERYQAGVLVQLTADTIHYLKLEADAGSAYVEVGSEWIVEPTLALDSDTAPACQPGAGPSISGDTASGAGQVLTCTTGTWDASPTPTYAYQWLRAGVAISGATSATYTTQAADLGLPIACVVTATNRAGKGSAVASEVGPILSAPVNTAAPVVSGLAVVGEVLSTTDGTWTGEPAPTYTYQWYTSAGIGTPISGATEATYTLTSAELGLSVWCAVWASNAIGLTSAITSTIGPVTSAPVPVDHLLLEDGSDLLLEDGGLILLE